jgi:hypothetical protein
LPTFLIIGATRSGTSWLRVQLDRHPDVALPPDEIRYFDFWLFRSIGWYGSHYRGLEAVAARGDKSPTYLRLSPDRIRLIRRLMPEVRLVLMVRDPVERAWSGYRRRHAESEHVSLEDFAQAQARSRSEARFQGLDPASEGRYVPAVVNWLQVFPRERLLAVPFDRIVSDPRRLVQEVLVHIGVDPMKYPWEELSGEKVNATPPMDMPDDVRTYLSRHFAGEREALATLLRSGPLWREDMTHVAP